jgi:hypothetical protein
MEKTRNPNTIRPFLDSWKAKCLFGWMDLFVCFVVGWRVDGQSTDEKGERERDGRRQQEWTCCPKEKKKNKRKVGRNNTI